MKKGDLSSFFILPANIKNGYIARFPNVSFAIKLCGKWVRAGSPPDFYALGAFSHILLFYLLFGFLIAAHVISL